jgi:hypothetical protein
VLVLARSNRRAVWNALCGLLFWFVGYGITLQGVLIEPKKRNFTKNDLDDQSSHKHNQSHPVLCFS